MKPYQLKPGEHKFSLYSYEEQMIAGNYPRKKSQGLKDEVNNANRSRKKALRQKVKLEIKKEILWN